MIAFSVLQIAAAMFAGLSFIGCVLMTVSGIRERNVSDVGYGLLGTLLVIGLSAFSFWRIGA